MRILSRADIHQDLQSNSWSTKYIIVGCGATSFETFLGAITSFETFLRAITDPQSTIMPRNMTSFYTVLSE